MNDNNGHRWLFLAVFGLSSFLSSALFASELTVQAEVVDYKSRDLLQNVWVRLKENGHLLSEQEVEESPFSLTLDYKKGAAYQLAVEKTGYPEQVINLGSAIAADNLPELLSIALGGEREAFVFKGKVLSKEGGKPLSNIAVTVVNKMTGETERYQSDATGNYAVKVVAGYEYDVEIALSNYLKRFANINFCSEKLDENIKYCFAGFEDVGLSPDGGISAASLLLDEIVIGKKFRIDNIYYNYNQASLRADALPNLDKLFYVLSDNPQIIVELASHADSRGSDNYNLELSAQRAQSAADYVVAKGIDPKRIRAKGYGESILMNHCSNGVTCSDEEHEENRRTEFMIIDIVESASSD